MSRPPLDEKLLRRPSFSEGYAIRLCDGQEWTFPKPWLRFVPKRKEDGMFGMAVENSYGPEYSSLVDRYTTLEPGPDGDFDRLELRMHMAATLLIQNYDLSDDDLADLLAFEPDHQDNVSMWVNEIMRVLLGLAPKPSADGSDTPSSPTG